MAEAVLFHVAGDIITKLGSQALREIGLLWGVQDELQKLKDTVSIIQAVLLDAEEQFEKNNQVKLWLEGLKDAVYDADDLLDDFSTEALQRRVMSGSKMAKQVCIFFSSSNQLAFRLKMGHKIKAIRKRIDVIADYRANFGFTMRPIETRVEIRDREQTHSYVREEEVIGREEDKKLIIELLLDSNVEENVSIIPMVGIGGLGKTTLAQLVFNDEDVKKHFELRMWTCVSDNFDVKIIVEKIIKSATNDEPKNLEMDQLQNYLRKKIDGKKYLLVLDDVWNEVREKWLSLKKLLMGGARGSRILVTTRAEKVAMVTSSVSPYVLKGLTENESWSLFMQIAFERGQEPKNPMIVGIGKQIVTKCVGVPLAIRAIGSLMYFKKNESEWQSFKNNELSKIAQKEDILSTLRLSYDHLSSHLKHCFAYCRLFPKDYTFRIDTLIQLWVGQGFIKLSDPSQCLEDVGREYFQELLWRSFFQEVEENAYDRVVICKMHDLMHDLAIKVTGIEGTALNSIGESIDEKTRHISFDFNFESSLQFPVDLLKANKARTFLLPNQSRWDENKERLSNLIWDTIVLNFQSLRVLDLHNCGIKIVPNSIRKLKRLRYLDLSKNRGIKKLPNSVTKLHNLQTLKLYGTSLKELPKDIRKMIGLRHLEISFSMEITHMPRGLGQLTSLQTLELFVVARDNSTSKLSSGLNELNSLNNLRGILRIMNLDCVKDATTEFKAANLKEKQHLESLLLEWNRENNDSPNVVDDEMSLEDLQPHPNLKGLKVEGYGGVRFPNWLSSVTTHLVRITIRSCFRCQYLPPLDQLPSLKKLSLHGLAALEYVTDKINGSGEFCHVSASSSSSTSAPIFFPSLQYLRLDNCPNLKGWWREVGTSPTTTAASTGDGHHFLLPSFPALSFLRICDCPKLTSMPLFPYLEEKLWLDNTSAKPFQQTMMMMTTTTMAAAASPLSKLKSLWIKRIKDLESLPEEWLRDHTSLKSLLIDSCPRLAWTLSRATPHLSSLESMKISNCEVIRLSYDDDDDGDFHWQALRSLSFLSIVDLPKVESLPQGFQHFTTLQELQISRCSNLMALPEWIGNLTSLQRLQISDLPKVESLPVGLQHVTTLQELEILRCSNLMALPEWIGNLTSLQRLLISNCPNLESLPEKIRSLTSLQRLQIGECPLLKERCQKKRGEDWPKIAHIPNILIDYELIQGRY